jgi:hypothetical protein
MSECYADINIFVEKADMRRTEEMWIEIIWIQIIISIQHLSRMPEIPVHFGQITDLMSEWHQQITLKF